MCGIVAILGPCIHESWLRSGLNALSHRGPDGEGILIDGHVGFGHKRLSIIDLVSGAQPMTRGPFSIVFNGEIYNYVELRDELRREGLSFETTSDTEVILAMYEKYGLSSIDKLNGMFAFVLYDRTNGTIVAARDHFGIKPLYYCKAGSSVLFASEIKALLVHPDVKPEPDRESLNEYVTFQYLLGDRTLFRGIYKLPPGHYQVFDIGSGATKKVKYWEPNFAVDTFHTEEYFVYRLREILNDTVRMQLRSDVPVGTYISGGIDSSLVAMIAAHHYPRTLIAFTAGFDEGPLFNEIPYAREVALSCGASLLEVCPTEQEFIDSLPHLIYHMDEPAAGPGIFPQYIVSRLASQNVKVVLGGQGGDEIFGGYARFVIAYFEQAIKGAIFESHEEGEHIVSLQSILPNLPYLKQYVPMLKRFWSAGLFEPMDRRYFRLVDRSEGDLSAFSADFRSTYCRESVFARFSAAFNDSKTQSYYNKMVYYDLTSSLPALLQVEDRMSMAWSLESRVPLLDRRIVDLVTRIPPGMKFKGAQMKYILRKAMGDILPQSILNRKEKMGFPVPLHIWARNKAKGFFQDILFSSSCRQRGLFDHRQVERLIEDESAFGRKLWGILCLELWYRTFIDGCRTNA